jgi:TolB protein
MQRPLTVAALALLCACSAPTTAGTGTAPVPAQDLPQVQLLQGEPRLSNIRMLTNGGENAEAYFSGDTRKLIFQATRPGVSACDQIFTMNTDGSDVRMVSTGKGRTTCAYYFPAGDRILYSSTHEHSPECPPTPDFSMGYVWPLFAYDIYTAKPDGSDLRKIGSSAAYDAEATISPDGSRIVFTSMRDGDLEIYTMSADGSDVRRLTNTPGYDGGAFFSPDGTKIVYRARHPETAEELADYRRLLAQNLIRPSKLDIYMMDADGSNRRRITDNGAANFAPFWTPDGKRLIFSSNLHNVKGRNFDLFLIGADGTGIEQVTHHPDFDGFPMFSPDGATLVFASNRQQKTRGDTNIFTARWKP